MRPERRMLVNGSKTYYTAPRGTYTWGFLWRQCLEPVWCHENVKYTPGMVTPEMAG